MKKMLCVMFSMLILFSTVSPACAVNAAENASAKKTSIGLTEYVVKAYEAQWGYVYGTFGQVLTENLLESKAAFYPEFFYKLNSQDKTLLEVSRKWMGSRVVDCIGLVKSYLWTDEFGKNPVHYDPSQDKSADQAFEASSESGEIENIPNIHGLLLYTPGHVGIYIGNGEFIHAGQTEVGVTKGKLSESNFIKWYKCPWVEYPTDGEYSIAGQTFYYQNGEYVTGWSDGKFYGTDGIKTNAPSGDEIVISRAEATMRIGTVMQLKASSKKGLKYTWATSDKSVAEVDQNGTVKAVAPGNAVIYVRDEEDHIARCNVTVEERYKVYQIHMERSGAYENMPVTVMVETDVCTDNVLLKSANKDIECVYTGSVEDGKKIWEITFVANKLGDIPYVVIPGSSINQMWGASGGFTLHVGKPLKFLKFDAIIPQKMVCGQRAAFLLQTEGGAGKNKYIWEIYKDNALFQTVETESETLSYQAQSSGVYMVKVSAVDEAGRSVTARSEKFKVSGVQMELNRTSVIMNVGQNVALWGECRGGDGEKKWKSSAPRIVEVTNGTLTAKRTGNAVITLSSTNKELKPATCEVKAVQEDLTELESFSKLVDKLPFDLSETDSKTISDLLKKFASFNENIKGIYLNSDSSQHLIRAERELYSRSRRYDMMNGKLKFFGDSVAASPGIRVSDLLTKLVAENVEFIVVDQYDIPVANDSYLSNSMRIIMTAKSVVNSQKLEICSYTVVVRGDINGDGAVDISDYYILSEYIAGRRPLNKWQFFAADITAAGTTDVESPIVDKEDLKLLADWMLGKSELKF